MCYIINNISDISAGNVPSLWPEPINERGTPSGRRSSAAMAERRLIGVRPMGGPPSSQGFTLGYNIGRLWRPSYHPKGILHHSPAGIAGIKRAIDKYSASKDRVKIFRREILMSITFLKVKVGNPADPKKVKEFEFLIDSGAVYSVIPEDELKDLGIKPTSEEEFTLANGETITKPVGNAYFIYKGKTRAAPVVFGEKDVFLLGATALEALGMILDPIRRELKTLPMVLM